VSEPWLRRTPRIGAKLQLHFATCLLGILGLACFPWLLESHRAVSGDWNNWEGAVPVFGPSAWLRAHTGLDWLQQLWIAVVLVPLLLLVVIVLFEWIVRRLRLDPADDAWTSLAWAMRSWRGWLVWLAWLAGAIALSTALEYAIDFLTGGDSPDPWTLMAYLPAIAGYVGMAFFIGNAANLAPTHPRAFWRPRWPGGFAVVVVFAAMALSKAWEVLIDSRQLSLAADLGMEILLWVPSLIVTSISMLVWLNRSAVHGAGTQLQRAARPRVIAAMWVQQVRFGLILAPFVLLVLATTVLLNFVVPQLEDAVYRSGNDLSPFWHAWIVAMRWFSMWWWVVVLVLVWFFALPPARLLVQLGAVDGIDPAAALRPGDND
jgi:hypothetical protein